MIDLLIFCLLVAALIFVIILATPEYEKCYSEMEYKGHATMGCCAGLAGGTKSTDYLSETCIGCPHLVTVKEMEEINEKEC